MSFGRSYALLECVWYGHQCFEIFLDSFELDKETILLVLWCEVLDVEAWN